MCMTRRPRERKRTTLTSKLLKLAPLAVGAAVLAAAPSDANAAKNPNIRFGLGGGLGDPLGPSMKLFLHPQHALQFDLGWAPLHHGDGITHVNYLFHFKPFVKHSVLDFGMYLGGGLGMAFWAAPRGGRCYYEPNGRYRCDRGYYGYYRGGRHYYHGGGGGVAMIVRAPVGLFIHWKDVPLDTVMEGGWSPYVVHWDPWHGDFSIKVRYYF
jgi:hypothetical protein